MRTKARPDPCLDHDLAQPRRPTRSRHRTLGPRPGGAIADQDDERTFKVSGLTDADGLRPLITPSSIVLEIGCGTGRVLQHVAPMCAELHGIDISEEMAARGRTRLTGVPNIHFHHGNGYDLAPFPDAMFDLVYSSFVLQHVPKGIVFNYLLEVRRVLKPRGAFRFQVPNLLRTDNFSAFRHFAQPHFALNPYPMNFYTPAEVAQLLAQAVLTIEQMDDIMVIVARPGDPTRAVSALASGESGGHEEPDHLLAEIAALRSELDGCRGRLARIDAHPAVRLRRRLLGR